MTFFSPPVNEGRQLFDNRTNSVHAVLNERNGLMPDTDTPTKEFVFGDSYEGDSTVIVWCDGRDYDPAMELYYPVYSYSIISPYWRFDSDDIRGATNEIPDLDRGSQSLFAFLIACAEADESSENYTLFPPEVREWAQHFSDELTIEYQQLNK